MTNGDQRSSFQVSTQVAPSRITDNCRGPPAIYRFYASERPKLVQNVIVCSLPEPVDGKWLWGRVGLKSRLLLSGFSSAGLTSHPIFPIFFTPYQAVPATSSLHSYFNRFIIIITSMIRLLTFLLALTLATGSALASSNEYKR